MRYENQKVPKNTAEAECFKLLSDDGWFVTKKGWPDFACFRRNELILVEVKPRRSHRLKKDQHRIMSKLTAYGVKCYRWNPNEGFHLITPDEALPGRFRRPLNDFELPKRT